MSSKILAGVGVAQSVRRWEPKGITAEVLNLEAEVEIVQEIPPAPVVEIPVVMAEPEPELQPEGVPEIDPEVIDQTRAEAYALGLADGQKQVALQAKQEQEALQALLASFGKLRQDLEAHLADEVLALGLEIAKQVVRETIALKPETILPVLREAMSALPAMSQQASVHLHPLDAQLLQPMLATDPALAQFTWRVVEDVRMERGGCRLDTAQSEVDATLATRWKRVVAALGREENWRDDKAL